MYFQETYSMRIFNYILLVIILIVGVSFAGLNSGSVSINYYVGVWKLPLSLLIVISFAIGCLMGLLAGTTLYLRLKSQNFQLKNRIKLAEKEVSNLRTMPLQDNR